MFCRPRCPLQNLAVGFHELFDRDGTVGWRCGREFYRIDADILRAVLLVELVGGRAGAEDALYMRRLHEFAYLVRNHVLDARVGGAHDSTTFQFKQVYIGNNCTIRNSIVLNGVHIGDNSYIENCIIESKDTIKPNSNYVGENGRPKIVLERSDRYML